MDGQTPRRTWARRLVRALTLGLLTAAGLLVALPWLLATPPARSALVRAVNRALAPSRIELRGVSASWFGSIRLIGLKLHDASGKTLIDAPRATVDRGLLALALRPTQLGTISVEDAAFDIERRADGSIDLIDALVHPGHAAGEPPKATTEPKTGPDLTLRLMRGRLKLVSPELAEPLVAARMELEARLPAAADEVLSWRVRLAEPPGGTPRETLGLDGSCDHHAATSRDLSLVLKGERWPLALAGAAVGADVAARARFDGLLRLDHKAGRWAATGDARLLDLDASGPALSGDRLRFDTVAASWDLEQTADAWSVRLVKVKCPVADLFGRGEAGSGHRGPSARLEANVDLAALARQAPHVLRIRDGLTLERGSARVTADLSTEGETSKVALDAWLSDLSARDKTHAFTLRDPAALSAHGTRTTTGVSVQTLTLKAAAGDLKGGGDLQRGLTCSGSLDLAALQAQFRELIDFGGMELAGKARMAADYRRTKTATGATFVGRYAAEVRGLKVVGLNPEPLVRDMARFDVAAAGPADPSGLPQGWTGVRANLKSNRDTVTLSATNKDDTASMTATASLPLSALPVKLVERDGQVGAKVVGRWKASTAVVELDELSLSLVPADPTLAADGTLALAVRGRLELDADNLVLAPLPQPGPAGKTPTLALAPEGLRLHGVRTTPLTDRAAKLLVVGDVAALDRAKAVWTAGTPTGLAGALSAQIVLASGGPGKLHLGAQVQVPDLSRLAADGKGRRPEGPLELTVRGTYEPTPDRLTLDELEAVTRYATLSASGRIDGPTGRLLVDLSGTLTPVWPNVSALAAEMVEPGLKLTGGARPIRVKGPLTGGSLAAVLKRLDAEVGLELTSADAFGMKLGPTPLVVRFGNGAATIDPISATLNGGRVVLEPGLDVDETRGIALRLAPGSAISDAAINDEVCRRLLCYVAPVLDDATHVRGKISLAIENGDFPLVGPPERRVNMTGRLTFQDVVFAPGKFATEVLTLTGKPDRPGLKIRQSVQLAIADGRVTQKGLEIPVRGDASIGLDGSVGFDQTLDLRARVPLARSMLGQVAGLDKTIGGQRVTVPIGGTVQQPRVNRQALQVALKELSKGLFTRELSEKASDLLNQLAPPADAAGARPAAGAASGAPADPLQGLQNELMKRLAPRRRDAPAPPPPADEPGGS
jgi:translocation and assembly module TamB